MTMSQGGRANPPERVRLRSEWFYDPSAPLGDPGGFGAVFAGRGGDGIEVAVKRIRLATPEGQREIDIADGLIGRELQHVVRVFDAGRDASSGAYFIVMERASGSLQEAIAAAGSFDEAAAVAVLDEIAQGLLEVDAIVHRDLKPLNVLQLGKQWKIADFGIARFVEAVTSSHTLRGCLSPPYAAPEQWRGERASKATDIYALGCIGYALLTGKPPFAGPDFERQHLNDAPPLLEVASPGLRTILLSMLRKQPNGRPSVSRVLERLRGLAALRESNAAGLNALLGAGARVEAEMAQAAAKAQRLRAEQERRDGLAKSARRELIVLGQKFGERVAAVAPAKFEVTEQKSPDRARIVLTLGRGRLEIAVHATIPANAFQQCLWDVVAGGRIAVRQSGASPYERSASLWYTNMGAGEEYRWWEVCYMYLGRDSRRDEPFSLDAGPDADLAAAPIVHVYQLAAQPVPIDDEHFDGFRERWMQLLAVAAEGGLSRPTNLPLN